MPLKKIKDLADEIQSAYENRPDTNRFSDAYKQKLDLSPISDTPDIPGALPVERVYRISQADYDALPPDTRNSESIGFIING